jgi:hypothetical protein
LTKSDVLAVQKGWVPIEVEEDTVLVVTTFLKSRNVFGKRTLFDAWKVFGDALGNGIVHSHPEKPLSDFFGTVLSRVFGKDIPMKHDVEG